MLIHNNYNFFSIAGYGGALTGVKSMPKQHRRNFE
jgi:hypothetical protein